MLKMPVKSELSYDQSLEMVQLFHLYTMTSTAKKYIVKFLEKNQ